MSRFDRCKVSSRWRWCFRDPSVVRLLSFSIILDMSSSYGSRKASPIDFSLWVRFNGLSRRAGPPQISGRARVASIHGPWIRRTCRLSPVLSTDHIITCFQVLSATSNTSLISRAPKWIIRVVSQTQRHVAVHILQHLATVKTERRARSRWQEAHTCCGCR